MNRPGDQPEPAEQELAQRAAALKVLRPLRQRQLQTANPDLDTRQSDLARQTLRRSGSAVARPQVAIRLVEMTAEAIEPVSACRKGCSHCCHLRVEMSEVEASELGKVLGREPNRKRRYMPTQAERFGYDTPCPSLKDSLCSIYEHRPLACRKNHNLDVDDLFCRLDLPLGYRHQVLRASDDAAMLVYGSSLTENMRVADIRDWFPGPRELQKGPVGKIRTVREHAREVHRLDENVLAAGAR